jgi:hypothetical protein
MSRVFQCDDCSKTVASIDELLPVTRLHERVAPMPAGECPACGALCHVTTVKAVAAAVAAQGQLAEAAARQLAEAVENGHQKGRWSYTGDNFDQPNVFRTNKVLTRSILDWLFDYVITERELVIYRPDGSRAHLSLMVTVE